jgi:hypothetical protein
MAKTCAAHEMALPEAPSKDFRNLDAPEAYCRMR